jgi:release factor glutamine methyltransferase
MAPKLHRSIRKLALQSLFPARAKQSKRLAERKNAIHTRAYVCGTEFDVYPGVYQTSIDTELMCSTVRLKGNETLLEIGCGCGAVTILLAQKCALATGVDINPIAVDNARLNAQRLVVANTSFLVSDVFEKVTGKFDVIVCNPPYNHSPAADPVERMFWDPEDEAKRRFFRDVNGFLKKDGRIYFGWADFADLDGSLPIRWATAAGLKYVRHYSAPALNGAQCFFVIELKRA